MIERKENSNIIPTEAEEITNSDSEVSTEPPKKPSFLFYLFYVLVWLSLIGNFAATIIPSIIGQKPLPNASKGIAVGVAIVTGMTARLMGKSGWTWFCIGIPFGLAAIFLLAFFISFFRNM
jgi:hypothetical protein